MHCTRSITEENTNTYKIFIGKYESKIPFWKRKIKWDFIIKMNFRDTQCKFLTWTELAQVAVPGLLRTENCVLF